LAGDHLIAGNGWGTFEDDFVKNLKYLKEKTEYDGTECFTHPHNMYISILYAGGIPALFLFMTAFVLSIVKSWRGLKIGGLKASIPWHLICFILMISMAIYGTNGDIFEARRDIAVFFWASWGVLLMLPESCTQKAEANQNENC
jgi:O-antigen ligase